MYFFADITRHTRFYGGAGKGATPSGGGAKKKDAAPAPKPAPAPAPAASPGAQQASATNPANNPPGTTVKSATNPATVKALGPTGKNGIASGRWGSCSGAEGATFNPEGVPVAERPATNVLGLEVAAVPAHLTSGNEVTGGPARMGPNESNYFKGGYLTREIDYKDKHTGDYQNPANQPQPPPVIPGSTEEAFAQGYKEQTGVNPPNYTPFVKPQQQQPQSQPSVSPQITSPWDNVAQPGNIVPGSPQNIQIPVFRTSGEPPPLIPGSPSYANNFHTYGQGELALQSGLAYDNSTNFELMTNNADLAPSPKTPEVINEMGAQTPGTYQLGTR